jgi:Zn-dependent membrane protease YugP
MPMSDDERRRFRELEAEMAHEPRLARLARHLELASVYTAFRRIAAAWIAGGSLGLLLVVIGTVVHSTACLTAGVIVLVGTVLAVGVALIVVEVARNRRERRSNGR